MDYMSTVEAARKWGCSLRNVQRLLNEGRVREAKKIGVSWLIPANAAKPDDPRRRRNNTTAENKHWQYAVSCVLPKGDPDNELIYVPDSLHSLAEADFAFRRGDVSPAKELWRKLGDGDEAKLSASSLAIACAISSGDYALYYEINEWLCRCERDTSDMRDKALLSLPRILVAASISAVEMLPEWLKQCDFSLFTSELTPFLLYLYALYLRGTGDYKALISMAGAAIALCKSDDTFTWLDIYFGVLCASAYHSSGNIPAAQRYLNNAAELAMPYGFIAPFADYYGSIGGLIEKTVCRKYPQYIKPIQDHWKSNFKNFTDFHNKFTKENITTLLTAKEYQIARLLANGFTYAETAYRMNLSVGRIKNIVLDIYGKLGINKRSELHKYII